MQIANWNVYPYYDRIIGFVLINKTILSNSVTSWVSNNYTTSCLLSIQSVVWNKKECHKCDKIIKLDVSPKKIRILIYVNKLYIYIYIRNLPHLLNKNLYDLFSFLILQFILRIHDEDITTIGARISGLHSHTGRIIRKRGWRLWCANIQFKLEEERIRNASSSEVRSNKTWTLRRSENS